MIYKPIRVLLFLFIGTIVVSLLFLACNDASGRQDHAFESQTKETNQSHHLPDSLDPACLNMRYIIAEFGNQRDTESVILDTTWITDRSRLDSLFSFIRKYSTEEPEPAGDSLWVRKFEVEGFSFSFTYSIINNRFCPAELLEYFF